MSGAVQQVGSGGTIIVRTGQLAGIGPVGPAGQKGDVGPAGPIGPEGPVGPAGAVIEQMAVAEIAAAQSIGPSDEIIVQFGSILLDPAGWFDTLTNVVFDEVGAFMVNAWVLFDYPGGAATGLRELYLVEDGGTDVILARTQVPAVADDDTVVGISFPFESDTSAVYNLKARSTDALSVAIAGGRIAINRIGAGPEGPQGPEGAAGPVGPVGPAGPTGADGSASSGYTTIADLGE